jgi:hypothetical protein
MYLYAHHLSFSCEFGGLKHKKEGRKGGGRCGKELALSVRSVVALFGSFSAFIVSCKDILVPPRASSLLLFSIACD